jgi:hypothetical protein
MLIRIVMNSGHDEFNYLRLHGRRGKSKNTNVFQEGFPVVGIGVPSPSSMEFAFSKFALDPVHLRMAFSPLRRPCTLPNVGRHVTRTANLARHPHRGRILKPRGLDIPHARKQILVQQSFLGLSITMSDLILGKGMRRTISTPPSI